MDGVVIDLRTTDSLVGRAPQGPLAHVLRLVGALALGSLLGLGSAAVARADDEPPGKATPAPKAKALLEDRVGAAIKGGVTWLAGHQLADGSWGPCVSGGVSYGGGRLKDPTCYVTGPTTFSMFTLARCGMPPEHEAMQRGLRWVRKQLKTAPKKEVARSGQLYASYESASAILMFTALYDTPRPMPRSKSQLRPPQGSPFKTSDWQLMHECVKHLVGSGGRGGAQQKDGSWSYQRARKDGDVSATQFALLALRAAVRAGYPLDRVAPEVWSRALKYLASVQQKDGSFPYRAGEAWSMGMTAAGVASLLIAREQVRLRGKTPGPWVDPAVERGLAFLGKHYEPPYNQAGDRRAGIYYHYCYIYAIERVGSLARRVRLGSKDWYALGAEWLLTQQQAAGHWEDPSGMKPIATLGTCFALLFLKRATLPVVTGAAQPK